MNTNSFRIGTVGVLFGTLISNALAQPHSIEQQLENFKKNPKAFMKDQNSLQKYRQKYEATQYNKDTKEPIAWELISEEPDQGIVKFSQESIETRNFVLEKNKFHEGLAQEIRPGRARIEATDRVENLIGKENVKLTKIQDMDKYLSGQVENSPWSSDYWALYTGSAAKRYADDQFPGNTDWKANADYILSNNSCSVDNLSPSEKYDLLVGDSKKTLTNAVLNEGRNYYDKYNKVETWMGICHGWAPAAYMEPRPKRAIEVRAYDKKAKIKFYPSDIKALASLLWAKAPTKSLFIGSRCNTKTPKEDPKNGRIIDAECFDTNPGTWHNVVINQIGVHKRSFILDATYDYEVWNQPGFSYEIKYFNPKTKKTAETLADATVSLKDPEFQDTFSDYRNDPRAVSVVGIAMKFVYIAETKPTHEEKDNDALDRRVAVNYLYDLEIDKDGKIIGGEWYHQQHPDFLWTPDVAKDVDLAQTAEDRYLTENHKHTKWFNRGHNPIPTAWQQKAIESAERGQPLRHVVQELIQKSNQYYFLGIPIPFNRLSE